MTADDRTFNLREPLSERSRLARRSEVQVGLLHDQIVLFQPVGAMTCALDEHAAGLWLECVGQPFAEVIETATASGDSDRREIIELFRALRLLAMIDDAENTAEIRDSTVHSQWPRSGEFQFCGELNDSEDEPCAFLGVGELECTLDLDQLGSTNSSQAAIKIVISGTGNEPEHQLLGLEAITALAGIAPANPIDVLTRLVSTHQILVRAQPTEPSVE